MLGAGLRAMLRNALGVVVLDLLHCLPLTRAALIAIDDDTRHTMAGKGGTKKERLPLGLIRGCYRAIRRRPTAASPRAISRKPSRRLCSRFPWSGYRDGLIQGRAAKTGEPIWMPAHPMLRELLEGAPKTAQSSSSGHAANRIRRTGSVDGFSV
jgi:hypothetical protein